MIILDKLIDKLIDNELKAGNEQNPPFHSRHEAYGVMKEEYEELKAEIDDIGIGVLEDYWKLVRRFKHKDTVAPGLVEKGYYSTYGDKEAKKLLDLLESAIKCSFKELIQVGAMAQKGIDFEEKQKESIKKSN